MEFWQIAHELYRVWKEYSVAKAKWEMYNESKKSVLATIASTVEWSEAKREREARASDEFKIYLAKVQHARQKELELKYELDSLNMGFEYQRSMNSVKKKEMNLL